MRRIVIHRPLTRTWREKFISYWSRFAFSCEKYLECHTKCSFYSRRLATDMNFVNIKNVNVNVNIVPHIIYSIRFSEVQNTLEHKNDMNDLYNVNLNLGIASLIIVEK